MYSPENYIPGVYTLTLVGADKDLPDVKVSIDLTIEVIDTCQATTFTIDDTVFKPAPELTVLQFLNYEPLSISWTDSIILPDLNVKNNPCGAIVHELWDVGTTPGQPLNPTVFAQNDLT